MAKKLKHDCNFVLFLFLFATIFQHKGMGSMGLTDKNNDSVIEVNFSAEF